MVILQCLKCGHEFSKYQASRRVRKMIVGQAMSDIYGTTPDKGGFFILYIWTSGYITTNKINVNLRGLVIDQSILCIISSRFATNISEIDHND